MVIRRESIEFGDVEGEGSGIRFCIEIHVQKTACLVAVAEV